MNSGTVALYSALADRKERDPIVTPGEHGRATVPMGRGFDKYRRFHPGETYIYVTDAEGRQRALTRRQADVFDLARTVIDGRVTRIRDMAAVLHVSPSTVSRALTRLSAFGLLAYASARGRYGGTLIFSYVRGTFTDRLREAAKDRVRRWREAAEARVSRLISNVAPYLLERREGVSRDSLYDYLSVTTKSATLELPWTPEALREAGIL